MSEEVNENLQEESVLLDEYKKLQANTVSKEKYEKDIQELKEKNKLYLQAITEGKEVNTPQEENVSLEDKIKGLNKFKGTNLQYWEKMSSAIDSMLKSTPEAEIVKVTGTEGLEEMIKVNEGMKKMIKDSNGNPDMFRTLYKERVMESAPRIASEIEKAGSLTNYLSNNK